MWIGYKNNTYSKKIKNLIFIKDYNILTIKTADLKTKLKILINTVFNPLLFTAKLKLGKGTWFHTNTYSLNKFLLSDVR